MKPRGASRRVLVAIFAALLSAAALPAPASADVPLSPGDRGDCSGAEGLVCHRKVGGSAFVGICHKSRQGEMFCATDEDSARAATELLALREERTRRESICVGTVLGIFAVAVWLTIGLLRRKKPPEPVP